MRISKIAFSVSTALALGFVTSGSVFANYDGSTNIGPTSGEDLVHSQVQTITYSNGEQRDVGIYLTEGETSASYTGAKFEANISSTASGHSFAAVQVKGTTKAEFAAEETIIRSEGKGGSGRWGFGLLVNGVPGGASAEFTGGNVSIYTKASEYTAQTLTVKAGSQIDFNNHGNVLIEAESSYGVTVVDAFGTINFNNTGDVLLKASILPANQTGMTNVVGIQGTNADWTITDNVSQFKIDLSGAGVDYDGTSYSTGTHAIDMYGEDMHFAVNSKQFIINMNIASDVEDVSPGGHTAEQAYAVFMHKGASLEIGADTQTAITIQEGLGVAYGIYAGGGASAEFKGETSINVNGVDGSVAVLVDGTDITSEENVQPVIQTQVTFSGQNNSLTGDVIGVNKANLSFQSGNTKIDGNVSTDTTSVVELKNAAIDLAAGKKLTAEGTFKSTNGEIIVNEVSEEPILSVASLSGNLTVASSGALNDTFASPEEAAAALQKSVDITTGEGSESSYSLTGKSGTISDAWSANSEGKVTQRTQNESLNAFENFNAMTLVAWRGENNHLTKRLGDIRDNAGSIGAWARVYGYDAKYSDVVSIKYKSNAVQAGADFRFADNYVAGAAFSYSDGEGEFSNGSADAESYTLAAYLSGFFPCGGYFDVIGRAGRLSTDISAANQTNLMQASYDNTVLGLSAEIGWRYDITSMFYVEPQAELSYAVALGDDFTSSNGVKVEQDNYQSLVGRLGARLGANFADNKGSVYLTASVNHDFLGDADSTAKLGNVVRDQNVDAGGTWVSYGLGAQFNTTENLSFYGSLEKASGSEYREDYRYNVGFRYVW